MSPGPKKLRKNRTRGCNRNGDYSDLKSIGAGINKMAQKGGRNFFKDFSIGCGSLIFLGFLLLVLVPLIYIGFKIALWLAIPIVGFIIVVILVALFGRFISETRKRW